MKTQFTPSGHTPGPWASDRMFLGKTNKDRRSGFIVNGPDADPLPVRICDIRCSPESPFAVSQANARLIAAAPELLEALNSLSESVSAMVGMSDDEPSPFLSRAGFAAYEANKQALAAITKATSQP